MIQYYCPKREKKWTKWLIMPVSIGFSAETRPIFFEEMGEVVDRLRFEMAEVIGPSAGD